jgi:hypothetical protein
MKWNWTTSTLTLVAADNCLCSACWRWASSARNMQRPLIRNKLNTKTASRWFYYTDKLYFNCFKPTVPHECRTWFLTLGLRYPTMCCRGRNSYAGSRRRRQHKTEKNA